MTNKNIIVSVKQEMYERIIEKSHVTGVRYSEVVRRFLNKWLEDGLLPPPIPVEPKIIVKRRKKQTKS